MSKPYYNPRNKNVPIDGTRQSWSSSFDERVERRREDAGKVPTGFLADKGPV